jgi:hypothetical protein
VALPAFPGCRRWSEKTLGTRLQYRLIELMKSAAIGGGKPVRRALQLDEQ